MHFDAVIIGSGPAGCAAAIRCHQGGLKTAIVPGNKAYTIEDDSPSESIHPGVETILKDLDASGCIPASSRGIYHGIQAGNNYTPLGAGPSGAWAGNHINRAVFDAEMLKCAGRRGVQILGNEAAADIIIEKERVVGLRTNSGKEISSTYVIDASGYRAFAGRKLRFKKKFFSPPLVTWTGVSAYTTNGPGQNIASFHPNLQGWAWIAPEPGNRCTWTRLAPKGQHDLLPPGELRHLPLIGKIKTSNRRWQIFRPVCREGVILCGDAAGIIDPAAGQGILNALLSGMMAAKAVHSIIKNPGYEAFSLATYDDWFLRNYMDKVEKLKGFYALHGISL
jgi:flavin-dependent dehydrogenase